MRRSVSVALVAGVLAALAASGVASSTPGPALAPPPLRAPHQPGPAAGADPSPAAGADRSPAAGADWSPAGRQQVGTVEQVDTTLGYRPDAARSARFHYPGAEYVKIHLRRLALLPGDYLTVSDPSGAEVHRYQAGDRWAMSVTGDTAVLTLHRTGPVRRAATALDQLGVVVDRVARGSAPAGPPPAPPPPDRVPESVCGRNDSRDAVCYRSRHPAIYRNTKPVARLLIDGVELCTAFRVGPGNRLLTNHHCLASSAQARRSEVWFNYQCASCGGWGVFRPTKVRGDRVLDTDEVLDFTLFTVDNFGPVAQFGHLELADRPTRAGQELYIPQHPAGLPTRVALGSDRNPAGRCAVADPRVHGYGWFTDVSYYCDTQRGSSGSPVLSRDSHRVVALHHLGGCPNSGVRMDLIHDRIARWLPPSSR